MAKITIQDFHALDRLLPVIFADAEGKTGRTEPQPVLERPTAGPKQMGAGGAGGPKKLAEPLSSEAPGVQ